jgi:hypothetical protein
VVQLPKKISTVRLSTTFEQRISPHDERCPRKQAGDLVPDYLPRLSRICCLSSLVILSASFSRAFRSFSSSVSASVVCLSWCSSLGPSLALLGVPSSYLTALKAAHCPDQLAPIVWRKEKPPPVSRWGPWGRLNSQLRATGLGHENRLAVSLLTFVPAVAVLGLMPPSPRKCQRREPNEPKPN